MASIVENILGDKALSLAGEEFVRKLSFGNNWNKIRIGVIWRINGAATMTACRFHLGLNNGDTNTLASSTCSGNFNVFPGWYTGGVPGTFTYDGANSRYQHTIYTLSYSYKVGNSLTSAVWPGTNATQYFAASTSSGPRMNFGEFTRLSATQYAFNWYYNTVTQFNFGVPRPFDLLKSMESEDGSGWMANFATASSEGNVSGLSTSLSSLDTLSIYWNQLLPLEISALAVARYR
jgi:hypothetical protein